MIEGYFLKGKVYDKPDGHCIILSTEMRAFLEVASRLLELGFDQVTKQSYYDRLKGFE